jgi:hypothetical protein
VALQRYFDLNSGPTDGRLTNLGPSVSTDPQNQSRFRVQSPPPPFTINAIVGNSFVPAGSGTSVADGFYVVIRPLTPGSHRLLFSGTIAFADGSTFVINTDYGVPVGH